MQNMISIEALLLALPKTEYGEVKNLRLANKIWNYLKSIFYVNLFSK